MPAPIDLAAEPTDEPKGKAMPSFKILSHEGISPPRQDGKVFIRGVFGPPPLGDSQTHEFEFASKAAMYEGVRQTEEKFTELDYCHLSISAAIKADSNMGLASINARVGKAVTIDLAGAVASILIAP